MSDELNQNKIIMGFGAGTIKRTKSSRIRKHAIHDIGLFLLCYGGITYFVLCDYGIPTALCMSIPVFALYLYMHWIEIVSMDFKSDRIILERLVDKIVLHYVDIEWFRMHKIFGQSECILFLKIRGRRRPLENIILCWATNIGGWEEARELIKLNFKNHGIEMREDKRRFRLWF